MFTPVKIDAHYFSFAVQYGKCPKCEKDMVSNPPFQNWDHATFSSNQDNSFESQVIRAGLVIQSKVKVDDEYICINCEAAGLVGFECSLCLKRKDTSKAEDVFGNPPEYVCSDCYAVTPAKEWDLKLDQLRNKHKYDFE